MPNSNFKKIRVQLEVDGRQLNEKAIIEIPKLNITKEINCVNGKADFEIKADPELWSPENLGYMMLKLITYLILFKIRLGLEKLKPIKQVFILTDKGFSLRVYVLMKKAFQTEKQLQKKK